MDLIEVMEDKDTWEVEVGLGEEGVEEVLEIVMGLSKGMREEWSLWALANGWKHEYDEKHDEKMRVTKLQQLFGIY